MQNRIKTVAALTAIVALSSVASAQTFPFTRTELGRVTANRFATTTQQLMASVDVAISLPAVAEEASLNEKSDLITDAMLAESWGATALNDDNDKKDGEAKSKNGFFGSTMGRISVVSLAGLAGASYYALHSAGTAKGTETLQYTVANGLDVKLPSAGGPTIASLPDVAPIVETPEPATVALMAFGLGAVGLVARRRTR